MQNDTNEKIDTAIQYLNNEWLRSPSCLRNLEVRLFDKDEDKYGYFDLDTGKFARIMHFWEVIEEAEKYRLIEWRRVYFKPVDGGIQCSVCGEKFERASQHIAPCVQSRKDSA